MTSGNLSGEPIVTDDDEALRAARAARRRLAAARPADPRAVRRLGQPGSSAAPSCRSAGPAATRRCRSRCRSRSPPMLAVGADLKNTCALAAGRYAWVSQHIGDMDDLATAGRADRAPRPTWRSSPGCGPSCSSPTAPGLPLQPTGRASTPRAGRSAPCSTTTPTSRSVMGEHGLGGDDTGDRGRLRRHRLRHRRRGLGRRGADRRLQVASGGPRTWRYVPLAGGDASVLRPYRMALAHLRAAGVPWTDDLPAVRGLPAERSGACSPTS